MPGKKTRPSGGDRVRDEYGLTRRWRAVADAYLSDNARSKTNAYAAIYDPDGTAIRKSMHQGATVLFSKQEMKAYVAMRNRELAEECHVDQYRIVNEWARVGFSDIGRLFDAEGKLKPIHQIDDDTRACIAGYDIAIDRKRGQKVAKIRLWPKNQALEALARSLNMFAADNAAGAAGALARANLEISADMDAKEAAEKYKQFIELVDDDGR